jgi:hypothetical protein
MPYISRWEAPAVFVTVQSQPDADPDVIFYHSYKGEHQTSFWYCADPAEYEGDIGPFDFDIRQVAKELGMATPDHRDDHGLLLEHIVREWVGGMTINDDRVRAAIRRAMHLARQS